MATEDFTGFTEVDPSGQLTVSATKIDFTSFDIEQIAHVNNDYGVGYFGDFVVRFRFTWTSATKVGGQGGAVMLSAFSMDALHTLDQLFDSVAANYNDSILLSCDKQSNSNFRVRLLVQNETPLEIGVGFHSKTSLPQDIWFELSRVGSTGTVSLKIYSDAYSTLVTTLSTSAVTQDMSFRYLTAVGSFEYSGDVGETDVTTGYIENFEIISNVPLTSPPAFTPTDSGELISLNVYE